MAKNNIFEFESETEAILALRQEGYRLQEIAMSVWMQYENSYHPKEYVRTNRSKLAFKLSDVIKIDEDTLGIRLDYVNDLAYHPSIVNKGGSPMGHSFMLISEGWTAKKLAKSLGRDATKEDHFVHYKGFDYITKVIAEFEQSKHKGITLEFQWQGSKFKKKKSQPNVLK